MSVQQQASDDPVMKFVDWEHVSPEDTEALNDIVVEIIKAHPELHTYCFSIGTELVGDAFTKALGFHFPNHQTILIADADDTVAVTTAMPRSTSLQTSQIASTSESPAASRQVSGNVANAVKGHKPKDKAPQKRSTSSGTWRNPLIK